MKDQKLVKRELDKAISSIHSFSGDDMLDILEALQSYLNVQIAKEVCKASKEGSKNGSE